MAKPGKSLMIFAVDYPVARTGVIFKKETEQSDLVLGETIQLGVADNSE